MTSSLLGSWIDLEAATSAARELCPPEFLPAEESSLPLSLAPLALGDFQMAEDYKVDRYPVNAPAPAMRARLTEIRNRAARAGLLGQGTEAQDGDLPSAPVEPALPPLAAVPDAATGLPEPSTRREPALLPGANPPTPTFGQAGDEAARPFVPPLGPLNLRARALSDWLREIFAPTSLFISDAQGRALVEFDVSPGIIAGAIVLADAGMKARRHLPGGDTGGACAVSAEVAPGQTLSLLTADTTLGLFHIGLIGAAPLTSSAGRAISRALRKTVEAP